MSERRSTGSRVFAAREAKGLSLRRAARRLGVSPRALRGWERGREDIPFTVRQSMVKLYGLPSEQLIPERPAAGAAGRDGSNGMIRIGSVTFVTHDADDDSLQAFLAAVRRERGLAPNAPLAVRASDAAVLAELLGGTAEDIVRNLRRLLGVDEREAVELGRWMFRKTAIAGALAAGLAAGVVVTGTFSSNPPAAAASEITAPSAAPAPVDPDWAEIGDAAVLWREGVPHD
ncbi:MAG TPA: helix-turn-helix transcriptional regulator [Acidimicrobiia bacterium]|jgi:transcriptional regulator with XRE-family HTH domain|nr:helix-turn-helix transcriptional regulator [Acidimicrobiia bacterium]